MQVLSKKDCSKCVALKNYLKHAKKAEFEEVTFEEHPELFRQLNVRTAPALIRDDGEVLFDCSPSNVDDFLEGK